MTKVLVTGGSGFIGSHAILQLLDKGYAVRTTVRNLNRAEEARGWLAAGGAGDKAAQVEFVAADLLNDAGWAEAVAGCDYVLHIASPFPAGVPKHENDLIIPARDGALRVLRAARDAGVKRVVLTSSFAAVGYSGGGKAKTYTEEDWTNPDHPDLQPYTKSKTIAEKAAWDFIAKEGGALELSVVNPVGVFGPVLGPDFSTSILLVQRFLNGTVPGCPRLWFGCVDVRDVADLHIRAMTDPAAKGERFLAVAGDFLTMLQISTIVRDGLGEAGKRAPSRELPDILVRTIALFDPAIRLITPELGKKKNATNEKARRLLGWAPRSNAESILATARSLVERGLV